MPYPCNNYFVLFLTVAFGVLFCVIIRTMKKLIGLGFFAAAIVIPFAANSAFDHVGRNAWIASAVCLAVGVVLFKLKSRKRSASSKALYGSLADFADAAEAGEASTDPTIKAVFKDLYLDLNGLSDLISNGEAEAADEAITDIQYNLERIIYPNGPTEKQALSLNKRNRKASKTLK